MNMTPEADMGLPYDEEVNAELAGDHAVTYINLQVKYGQRFIAGPFSSAMGYFGGWEVEQADLGELPRFSAVVEELTGEATGAQVFCFPDGTAELSYLDVGIARISPGESMPFGARGRIKPPVIITNFGLVTPEPRVDTT